MNVEKESGGGGRMYGLTVSEVVTVWGWFKFVWFVLDKGLG